MVKKVLTFIMGLGLAIGAQAQWVNDGNDYIAQSDIQFWTGSGQNKAVVAITWNDDLAGNIGFAWGVQWNGTATIADLMDTLEAYDSRLSFTWSPSHSFITLMSYTDEELGLNLVDEIAYRCYNWQASNGNYNNSEGAAYDNVSNGDFIDWLMMDAETYLTTPADEMFMATAPNSSDTTEPVFCDSPIALPYSEDFNSYGVTSNGTVGSAPAPNCWTIYSDGTATPDGSNSSIYYSGIGVETSALTHGAIALNDAYFCFIVDKIYTGSDPWYLSDAQAVGFCKYAVLPAFDQPVSQTTVSFDYLTQTTGSELSIGYIVNDTADFTSLQSYTADNAVQHHVELNLGSLSSNIPGNARLAFRFKAVASTSSYNQELYCGIDNVSIVSSGSTPVDTTDAPTDATIAASDILYWVGNGSNHVIFAVNWADTALAWGYNFAGESVTVQQVMDDIAAADWRFSVNSAYGFLENIVFFDSIDSIANPIPYNWMSTVNGNSNASMGMITTLANGDIFKWGDINTEVKTDSTYIIDTMYGNYWSYTVVFPQTVYPVSIPTVHNTDTTEMPVDATIAASDILYWVGNGSNSVILAVNWADTALAWGYRFTPSSVTVQQVMDDIAAADWRFSTNSAYGFLENIVYFDSIDSLSNPIPYNWMSTFNGNSNASVGMNTTLTNGDIFKWGDLDTEVKTDSTYVIDTMYGNYWSYTVVFPQAIYPVSIPANHSIDTSTTDTTVVEHGPFCGPVGTEGCDAIAATSSSIVAWATGIELVRGPQNISVEGSPLVSYGTVDSAIGPATSNTMRAVSLGDGGTATVTFAHPIRNGEGPDFAVFENGFENLVYGNYSLELAFVEVSTDGERFVRFPATSLTQTESQTANAGGTDPTYINNLAGKYIVGYGTPFDLEELRDSTGINIDSIVYVRIVDVVGSIDPQYGSYDAHGNIINDPFPTPFASGGFDLTGVAVMYENTGNTTDTTGIDMAEGVNMSLWPNPATDRLNVSVSADCDAVLFDMAGRSVIATTLREGNNQIGLKSLTPGVYMLRIGSHVEKVVKR